MQQSLPLAEQIASNFAKVEASPEFAGDELWLTFYLWGPPENLRALIGSLAEGGWINLQGAEGGFLYPKVNVEKARAEAIRCAEFTERLCAEHGVRIILIDADISPDVGGEHQPFVTLYRSAR